MTDIKFCKDCKWFWRNEYYVTKARTHSLFAHLALGVRQSPEIVDKEAYTFGKCTHPKMPTSGGNTADYLVSGLQSEAMYATTARSFESLCGPAGTHFEPREDTATDGGVEAADPGGAS